MRTTIVTAAALLLGAGALVAQEEGGSKSFSELDVDGDGRLSVEEAQADMVVLRSFRDADADQDGYLTREEYEAAVNVQP